MSDNKFQLVIKKSCPFACHEGIRGSGGIAPYILNLGTKWEWFSLQSQPLCHYRKLLSTHWIEGWESSRAGLDDLEKTLLSLLVSEPIFLGCPLCSLVTIPTTMFKVIWIVTIQDKCLNSSKISRHSSKIKICPSIIMMWYLLCLHSEPEG